MLFFRVDANREIATGHLMRCLTIAEEAKNRGINATFIMAEGDFYEYLHNKGFSTYILQSDYQNMEEEIPAMKHLIQELHISKLIIDSYFVTEGYFHEISQCTKTVYIDDLCKEVYLCDMLICYANYYQKLSYEEKYSRNTRLVLGCAYVPLRNAFTDIKEKEIPNEVKEILIMSGGTDPFHVCRDIMERVMTEDNARYRFTAICGKYNADYSFLKERYEGKHNAEILQNVENMEYYMKRADVAISAGGTTLYELCACGTPTICYSYADNQLDNVTSFHEDGIMIYAGDIRNNGCPDQITEALEHLLCDGQLRGRLSKKMQQKVDGKGAARIVEEIVKL